jgi:hypothetical protein
MNWCLLGLLAVLTLAPPSGGGKLPDLPKVPPPEVVPAEAFTKGGAVHLRFYLPVPSVAGVVREVERGGKKERVQVTTLQYSRWRLAELEADGKQVRAFDVTGKTIAPGQVPRLLAKPTPVALFKTVKGEEPDPYYLRVLRPGTVVVTAPREKVTVRPRRD